MKKNEKKQRSIATKLTYYNIVVLFICLAVLTIIVTSSTVNQLVEEQQKQIELISENNADIIKEFFQKILSTHNAIINSIDTLNYVPESSKSLYLSDLVKHLKESEEESLSMFLTYTPDSSIKNYTTYATDKNFGNLSKITEMLSEENYKNISQSKSIIIADPYTKNIDGINYLVVTVMSPIIDKSGNFRGMIGSDINVETLNNLIYTTGGYESFYNLIICAHQTVINNTNNPQASGKKYIDVARSKNPEQILNVAKNGQKLIILDESTDETKEYRACTPFYIGNSKTVWISASSVSEKEFVAPMEKQFIIIILISIMTLFVLNSFIYLSIKKAFKPIGEIKKISKGMSNGILSEKIAYTSSDEIGMLANDLNGSMEVLNFYIADIDSAMGEMANCNFDLAPTKPFIGDFVNIENSITKFIISISKTINGINDSANQVYNASKQIADGAEELAKGSSEQAGGIEELSSSLSEFEQYMNTSTENAKKAKIQIGQAEKMVVSSSESMNSLNEAIAKINSKSAQIVKIIKTIEDIAFQTNILALNASVEAARAGEAGKGFSVVANEVGDLASRSSKAAKETSELIQDTINSVADGTKLAGIATKSMAGVVDEAKIVTMLIDEITKSATEQSNVIQQISEGLSQISSIVQLNSAASEESASASKELEYQADMLKKYISKFKVKNIL